MKTILSLTWLIASAGLLQADIIQTISLDISALHPGSVLSGTFSLPDSPMPGDTASVLLTFTDPQNYTPTSLTTTISLFSGTPSGTAVTFDALQFTNLSGTATPINTRDVSLTPFFFAVCNSFPCTATGLFQDRSPAVFNAEYRITPASAPIPEPTYALLFPTVLAALTFARRRR